MNAKLSRAVEAVAQLPPERQDRLAEALLHAATRELADARIAEGEASYLADGGMPVDKAFESLLARYDDR